MKTFCKLEDMTQTNSGQSLKTQMKITNFLEKIVSRRYDKKLYAFVSHCAGSECYIRIFDKVKLPNGNIQDIYVEVEPNCYQKNDIKISYHNSFSSPIFVELFPSYVALLENIANKGIDELKQELYNFITKKLKKEG